MLNTLAKGVVDGEVPDFNLLSLIRMNFMDTSALYQENCGRKSVGTMSTGPCRDGKTGTFGFGWLFMAVVLSI